MTAKRKIIIAIVAIAALALILIVGIFAWTTNQSTDYGGHIARAEKYLETNDYASAELAYQQMIEQEPEREEAYIGLVRVYTTEGKNSDAISTLRTGIERTDSAQLKLMLTQFLGTDSSQTAVSGDALTTSGTTVAAKLDDQLLSIIGGYTYNDYRIRYGIDSKNVTKDKVCQVRPAGLALTLIFENTDTAPNTVDRVTGEPKSDAVPTSVEFDDIKTLFGGSSDVTLTDIKNLGADDASLEKDDEHGYFITFRKGGCIIKIGADENGKANIGGWYLIQPMVSVEKTQDENSGYTLKGKVVSATTAKGVPKATVNFRRGTLISGTPLKSVETSDDGTYEVKLESDDYTAEVECSGYTSEAFKVFVAEKDINEADDFVISPTMNEGAIRIVLTWGDQPLDLDSYLRGTLDDGTIVRTNFMQKTCTDTNGNKLAELDVDDRNGNGPETTTLYNSNGVFDFVVNDFFVTNNMPAGSVTVKVYMPGESSPKEINICSGVKNIWRVFTIDHGKLEVVNEPYDSASTSEGIKN